MDLGKILSLRRGQVADSTVLKNNLEILQEQLLIEDLFPDENLKIRIVVWLDLSVNLIDRSYEYLMGGIYIDFESVFLQIHSFKSKQKSSSLSILSLYSICIEGRWKLEEEDWFL